MAGATEAFVRLRGKIPSTPGWNGFGEAGGRRQNIAVVLGDERFLFIQGFAEHVKHTTQAIRPYWYVQGGTGIEHLHAPGQPGGAMQRNGPDAFRAQMLKYFKPHRVAVVPHRQGLSQGGQVNSTDIHHRPMNRVNAAHWLDGDTAVGHGTGPGWCWR